MKTSKHEEAVQKFLAENPTWANRGLRKTINLILEDLEDVGFDYSLGFIPDAFEIDVEDRTVRLLEIDDGKRPSKRRMESLAMFIVEMHSRRFLIELHIINMITSKRTLEAGELLDYKAKEILDWEDGKFRDDYLHYQYKLERVKAGLLNC